FAQAVDARREKIEARLVANRRLGERGLLELRVDRIAVERRLIRHAVLELLGSRGASGQVTLVRALEPSAASGAGRFAQSAAKVDVAGFVSRRIGVRHVGREHLETARAERERLGVYAESGVDQLAHDRNIPECRFGGSGASSVPGGRIRPAARITGASCALGRKGSGRKRQWIAGERQKFAALAAADRLGPAARTPDSRGERASDRRTLAHAPADP